MYVNECVNEAVLVVTRMTFVSFLPAKGCAVHPYLTRKSQSVRVLPSFAIFHPPLSVPLEPPPHSSEAFLACFSFKEPAKD